MNRWLTKGSLYLNMALLATLLTIVFQSGLFEQWREALNAPISLSPLVALASGQPKPDNVTAMTWWQDEVQYRLNITRNQQYNNCVFGDSITSGLGNTLGDRHHRNSNPVKHSHESGDRHSSRQHQNDLPRHACPSAIVSAIVKEN